MIPKPYSHAWLMSLALLLMVATPALAEPQLPDFTELVDEAAPAVVNISTSRKVERSMTSSRQFGGQEVPEIFVTSSTTASRCHLAVRPIAMKSRVGHWGRASSSIKTATS